MKTFGKKALSLLLAIVMFVGMTPVSTFVAFAEESNNSGITIINDSADYEVATKDELAAAILNATGGDTIKLKANITLSEKLAINKAIILDLGGNMLSVDAGEEVAAITSTGALTIKGGEGGKLVLHGLYAISAPVVSISDAEVDLVGEAIGIYYAGTTGSASVKLDNVSGSIVGKRDCGIDLYMEINADNSADDKDSVSVVINDCKDLTINGEPESTKYSSNGHRSAIRVFTKDAETDCYVEINNSKVSLNGSNSGIFVDSHSDNSENVDDASAAWVSIENSDVSIETITNTWAAIFVNNNGTGEKATSAINITKSTVKALCPNDVAIMTSTKDAASTVTAENSKLELAGKYAGIRVKAISSDAADAVITKSTVTIIGETNIVVDEMDNGASTDATEDSLDEESTVVNPKTYSVATKAELDAAIAAAQDGDTIKLTADITSDTVLVINKAITLDLGGYKLTTTNGWGGLQLKNGCSVKNGTLLHTGRVNAIRAWDVVSLEDLVIEVTDTTEGKTVGGISIQENAAGIDTIKNVTIKGVGLDYGIETYNCGNAQVIGTMENVNIDAVGTGMLISAPCGTATNCTIKGGVSGIDMLLKGTYSVSIDLVDCTVEGGEQAVYAHDEQMGYTYVGSIELTADEDTDFVNANGAYLKEEIEPTTTVEIDDVRNYKVTFIGTVDELLAFAQAVQNGNTFKGETVKLTADIDFAGANWLKIDENGTVVTDFRIPNFAGTFDGQNHVIKNFNYVVSKSGDYRAMMFSGTLTGVVKNLTVENITATIAGGKTRVAAVANTINANSAEQARLQNVHVKDFTINCNNLTTDQTWFGALSVYTNGGNLAIKDCSVKNFTLNANGVFMGSAVSSCITPNNDYVNVTVENFVANIDTVNGVLGGFAGQTQSGGSNASFTNCTVTGLDFNIKKITGDNVGGFMSTIGAATQFYNCSTQGTIDVTEDTLTTKSVGGFIGDHGWNGMYGADRQHEFKNCVADVDITAVSANVGGFVGNSTIAGHPERHIPAYFTNCEAKGDVKTTNGAAGGFVGQGDRGLFTDCSASGNVEGKIAGGFWGYVYPKTKAEAMGSTHSDPNSKSIVIDSCSATGTVKGTDHEAGLIGLVKDVYVGADNTLGYATPILLSGNTPNDYNRFDYSAFEEVPSIKLYVAQVGDNKYESLAEAIAAANAIDGGATVTLLGNVTLGEKLTISGNVTISGDYTITRGIAGTIFAVDKNATLTLDGGVIIDGANNWTFDSENFYADMAAGKTLSTGAKNSYSTSAVGGLEATASMITISGTNGAVVMNNATIQNVWGSYLFTVPAGATLTMNKGTLIQHIRGQFINPLKGTWVINGGKITDVHSHNTNGGLVDMRDSSTFTINDGEICYVTVLGLNANGNGIVAQVFGNSAKLTINGGNIHDNASFSPGGGWGSVVYLNRGGDFEMNGGTIEHTASDHCTAFVSNTSTSIKLNAGTIIIEESKAARFDSLIYGDTVIGENMKINGDGLVVLLGDPGDTFENNGTIDSDMQICYGEVTGNGTYNGDVTVKKDDYFEFDGKVVISGGTWNGQFTVEDGASLSITGGTFKNDPSEWLAEGFKVTKLAGGTYGVAKNPAYGKVAQVGDVYYETLKDAIAAANAAENGATVTLLADVTLGEKLTISGNVTISGAYTITRADTYTGTLFTVDAGATLTLDGGLVIDGGNAWNYTKTPLEMDMANGAGTYVGNHITPAEGGVNATAGLIVNKGTLNANKVTIENCYSTNGVSVIDCGASSVTTLNGALMQNIAANRSGAVLYVGGADAVLTIKGDTRITGNFGIGNGGIIQNYGQGTTVNMEGGSIDNNHIGKSGTLYASYSGNANKINTFNMTGGIITKNVMEGYGPVYIHTNTVWNMSGGEISENISFLPSYVRNNNPAGSMTGGKIINNEITGLEYSNGYYVTHPDLRLNGKTAITGGTFTQDVSEYLAPNTGLVYDEATGTYTTTQDIWEMHLTDANGEAHWLSPMSGDTLAEILAANKTWYDSLHGTYSFTLKLLTDVKIDETGIVNFPLTIDLNGHTITATSAMQSTPVFRIVSDVTVKNGIVDGRNGSSCYAFIVGNSTTAGSLTIVDGKYYGDVSVVSVTNGTLTVEGGYFEGTEYNGAHEFTLNCIDSAYNNGTAKIVVKGGTFYKFNPENNAAEGAGTSFVTDKYLAEADGDYYTVRRNKDTLPTIADVIIKLEGGETITLTYPSERFDSIQKLIGTNDYADFVMGAEQSELLAYVANGNVTDIVMNLYDDIELDAPINFYNKYFQIPVEYAITLNGNGHTITWADGYTGTLINVESGVSVELKNLTIDGENEFTFYNDTTTVENGVNWYNRFVNVGEEDKAVNANVIVNAGNLTLNKVQIKNVTIASTGANGKTENTATGYVLMYNDDLAIIKSNGGKVTFDRTNISGNAGMVLNAVNAETVIANSIIDGNFGCGNKGGIIIANGGTMELNNASICGNKAMARSATILGVINGAVVTMNGNTKIDNNKHVGVGSNTAGAMIVLEGASQFVMNGGSISNNIGGRAGAIASRWVGGSHGQHEDTSIVLTAGTIAGNTASNDSWNGADIFLRSPATIGEGMEVEGTIVVNAAPGELDITGGTFTDFKLIVTDGLSAEITGGTFDNDPSEWLAEGYVAPKNDDGTYTARVQSYVEWVKEQLLAGNDVTLDRDIVVDGSMIESIPAPTNGNGKYPNYGIFNVVGDYDVTFDLNGHSITYNGHKEFQWNGKTINSCTVAHGLFYANAGADLTVKDSVGTGSVTVYGIASGAYVASPDTTFTITGGTWKNEGCATCGGTNIFLYPLQGGELYIKGGHFDQALDAEGESYLIVEHGGSYANSVIDYSKTKVVISGGTFVGMNPEEIKYFNQTADNKLDTTTKPTTNGCELGLMAKENDDGTYGVKEWDLVIRNTDDMLRFAAMVTAGNNFAGKTIKLGADIDLAGIEWSPIGGENVYFAGEFDGQNHIISNLTQTKGARMGLFGLVEKAYIHNFTMKNVNFTVDENNARVGAIAGNLQYWNVVENVTIDGINVTVNGNDGLIGSVTGYAWKSQLGNVDVKNAVYTVNGTGNVIGGHTAYGRAHVWDKNVTGNNAHWLDGTVQTIDGVEYVLQNYFVDCDVDGIKITLNGTGSEVGGFFGSDTYNSHSNYFVDCHVKGLDVTAAAGTSQIVGGFIAWNNGTTSAGTVKGFDGCSASGTINGADGIYGGFVGQVGGRACEYYNASADVDITCTGIAGGFVGATQAYSTHKYTFTNCVAKGDVSGTVAGGFAGKNGMSGDGKSVFVEFNGCSASGKVHATSIAGGFIGEVSTELPATNWNTVDSTGSLVLIGNTASAKADVTGDTTVDYVGYLIGYFDGVANGDAKEGNTVELTLKNNTPDGSDIGTGTGHHINISGDTITDDITKFVAQIGDVKYESLQEAINAAKDNDTIVVLTDIDLAKTELQLLDNSYDTYFLVEGKTITINLNGKTISGAYTGSMLVGVFSTDKNGHLTLTGNGTVDVTATTKVYSLLVAYSDGSGMTIENGTYKLDKASDNLIYYGGYTDAAVTVKGGTFTLGNVGEGENGKPWIVNVLGAGDHHVFITGGTFNFDVNRQFWSNEAVVSEKCYTVDNGNGTWTVKDGAVAYVNTGMTTGPYFAPKDIGYATIEEAFKAAVNADDKSITLLQNVTLTEDIEISIESIVLNMNGFTFDCNGHEIKLTAAAATLTAPAGLNITSGVADYYVRYNAGKYELVEMFEIDRTNMRFSNNLSMLFAFAKSNIVGSDYYITLMRNGEIVRTYKYSEWASIAIGGVEYCAIEYDDIAAKEMCDEITVQVFATNGTEDLKDDIAVSKARVSSVREYAMSRLEKSTDSEFKTLIVDMLNYGAAAQKYFGYNTDDYANSKMNDEQIQLGTSEMAKIENKRTYSGDLFVGTNARFGNTTSLLFAFKADASISKAVLTYKDYKGVSHTTIIEKEAFHTSSSNYIVELTDLVFADARQLVTCTIYDESGNVLTTIIESLESNVARKTNDVYLYHAFMIFADSCYEYETTN